MDCSTFKYSYLFFELVIKFNILCLHDVSYFIFADIILIYRHASCSNVFRLLARREVSPRVKDSCRKLWRDGSKCNVDYSVLRSEAARDAKRSLTSW